MLKPLSVQWEYKAMPIWDTCRKGYSALLTAMMRATLIDVAGVKDEIVLALLWDFLKCLTLSNLAFSKLRLNRLASQWASSG